MASDQSIEVTVPRFSPAAQTRYRVRVDVTDNHGRAAQAETWFETGLMGAPFSSSWVEPVQEPTPDTMAAGGASAQVKGGAGNGNGNGTRSSPAPFSRDYADFRPAQYLRIPFCAEKPVAAARVYATPASTGFSVA